MIPIDHSGRVALVTGAGAGIGREITLWLARAGAAVGVNDLVPARAAQVVEEITAAGGQAVAVPANCRVADEVSAMVASVVAAYGRLDIAVNNVGMMNGRTPAPFLDTPDDAWDDLVAQNLLVAASCARAQGRVMRDQGDGGVILFVTSGETTRPSLGMAAYGAAKAAVNHLVMTMAVELGPLGIRVNAIAPGTTLTETVRAAFPESHVAALIESIPLRRMTEPDELARLTVFLASDLARCITGQLILADAGAHLSRTRPAAPPS